MFRFAIIFFVLSTQTALCEVAFSDIKNPNGSTKILWKDMSLEQKSQVLEWKRENAEYILKNIGKKCSELKDIPEYTKIYAMQSFTIPPKAFGPEDICFSSDSLRDVYRTLGEYDKWFAAERTAYEDNPQKTDPYVMVGWMGKLIAAGHYQEAVRFFPSCVTNLYPWFKEARVEEMLKKGEGVPPELSKSMISEPWEQVLKIRNKKDNLEALHQADEKEDLAKRMHRYFYSKDGAKQTQALEFYRKHKIKLMIDKAGNIGKDAEPGAGMGKGNGANGKP